MRWLKLTAGVATLAAALLAVWLAPSLAARERTRIALTIDDAADRTVERAVVEFLDRDGSTVARFERAGSRWLASDEPGADAREATHARPPGWGAGIVEVRVRAFACRRTLPVAVERESHGGRFGNFAPHPTPLTHVHVIRGALRCPAPAGSEEEGLELAQLLREIGDGEPWDRSAAEELTRIGPAALSGLPRVLAVLEQPAAPSLRIALIRALGAMGPGAAEAVASLARLFEDPDPAFRRAAATALEAIGPAAAGSVEALARAALRDPDRHTQEHIARILGRMGVAARAAEPDLVDLLEDESEEEPVRRAAFSALGHLDTATAREARERYAAAHPILY